VVDFVFEDMARKLRSGGRRSFLASVYFSPNNKRGGGPLGAYAARYMQAVQRVCNRDMHFFPTKVLAMCIYESCGTPGRGQVYARDVGIVF